MPKLKIKLGGRKKRGSSDDDDEEKPKALIYLITKSSERFIFINLSNILLLYLNDFKKNTYLPISLY